MMTISKSALLTYIAFFFFFLLRVIYCALYGTGVMPGNDSLAYNGFALEILKDSSWIQSKDFIGSYREPGYPLFLALIYFIFGKENVFAVHFAQALISTGTIVMITRLTFRMFDRRAAYVALFLSGFHIFYFYYCGRLLRETLVVFLITSLFYLLSLWMNAPIIKRRHISFIALLYVCLIHVDARYIYFLPVFGGLLFVYRPVLKAIKEIILFIMVAFLLSLPWAIRNYNLYGRTIIITNRWEKLWDYQKYIWKKTGGIGSSQRYLNKKYNPPHQSIIDRLSEKDLLKIASFENKSLVSTYWNMKWQKFIELYRIFRFRLDYIHLERWEPPWSLRHNLSSIISYGFLLPFFFLTAYYLVIYKDNIVWFFFIPLGFHTVIHTWMASVDRYRVPIDFLLIIMASFTLARCLGGGKRRLQEWRCKRET